MDQRMNSCWLSGELKQSGFPGKPTAGARKRCISTRCTWVGQSRTTRIPVAWSCCTFCRARVTTLKGGKAKKKLFIFPRLYGKSIYTNCSGVRSVWNKLWQPCVQPGCKQVNTREKFQLCQSRLWNIPAHHPFRIHVDLSRLLVCNYIVFARYVCCTDPNVVW